jgi:hypothetical protein
MTPMPEGQEPVVTVYAVLWEGDSEPRGLWPSRELAERQAIGLGKGYHVVELSVNQRWPE